MNSYQVFEPTRGGDIDNQSTFVFSHDSRKRTTKCANEQISSKDFAKSRSNEQKDYYREKKKYLEQ